MKTSRVADQLLKQLVGLNQVGIIFFKKGKEKALFFASVEKGRDRIASIILASSHSVLVGAQKQYVQQLGNLINNLIEEKRKFSATTTKTEKATVFDVVF